MVKSERENSVKSSEKQDVSRQLRTPAKINADTKYELCDSRMTAFGGLLALRKFVELVNFEDIFNAYYCSPSRKPKLGNYRMVLGFLILMFIGFARIGQFAYISSDPLVCGMLGVPILPAISTFWRYLFSLGLNQSRALLAISAQIRSHVWQECSLNYDLIRIDIDTTVSTVYGNIEGSRKGHNTKHRGKKGLRPVFLFIEETREYLCGTQRRGSTMTDSEMAKLIRDIRKYIPPSVKKVLIKGDAEFIGNQTIQACIACGYQFIFANKCCAASFPQNGWYKWNDYEYNETTHQPMGWPESCRFVVMRIREDQKGDRQLEMFEDQQYMYRVFATNIADQPHTVIKTYDKRASIEGMIKEAQQEGILAIPSRRFLSNHCFFQMVMLAYNMWRWIKLLAGTHLAETPASANIQPAEDTMVKLKEQPIVNHTIRIARLKMLFISAKIVTQGRSTTIKYSYHDARAAELIDFMEYIDKRRKSCELPVMTGT